MCPSPERPEPSRPAEEADPASGPPNPETVADSSPARIARRFRRMQSPQRIGPYRIIERLGEGGMGVVYLAEQTSPIHRRVALKIIKLGMDTRHALARFETESEALALMNHPNVATVFDAGVSDEGRPYFVMEYVPGIPITDYCDRNRLSLSERIELFIQVCRAVQHAHQKGIIHRDIKPSNVLITVKDDRPVPKVIDFGVAKATQQKLTERTLFTEQGQLIGTPGYMSPEQAEMTALDIDTRTDIYALGVLLYELLVGIRPFDDDRLRGAGIAEMQRIIREVDPPRPSARLRTVSEASAIIARKRRCDTRSLTRALRGDLDWIILKCLEKDRTRRYETAGALVADIERYLNHQPVQAGPPGLIYRTRKWVKRHRKRLAVAAVLIAALSIAAERERAAVRAARLAARDNALVFYFDALEQADAAQFLDGREQRDAYGKAVALCERALTKDPTLGAAYALRAKLYTRLGRIDEARADVKRALELEPGHSLALRTQAYLELTAGHLQRALDLYNRGTRALVSVHDLPEDFHNRAQILRRLGRYEQALEDNNRAVGLAPRVPRVRVGRALTRRFLGDIDGAVADLQVAADLIPPDKSDTTWFFQCRQWIWEMLMLRGRPQDRQTAAALLAETKQKASTNLERLMIGLTAGTVDAEKVLPRLGSPLLRAIASYYAGARALVEGRNEQAAKYLRAAVEGAPTDSPEWELASWHLHHSLAP